MSNGVHLMPSNFVLCVEAARQFAESHVGEVERFVHALDLMSGSVTCLGRLALESRNGINEKAVTMLSQYIGEMWLRLVQALYKLCLDNREEVRNHALLSFQKCLSAVQEIHLSQQLWLQCFDLVIFPMLDNFLEVCKEQSSKTYRNIEDMLLIVMKLLSKVFLLSINEIMGSTTFNDLWMAVITQMENFMRVKIRGKKCEKLQELVPELLKNSLLVMKAAGLLSPKSVSGGDSLWELTWSRVNKIAPSLQAEIFSDSDMEKEQNGQLNLETVQASSQVGSAQIETVASEC